MWSFTQSPPVAVHCGYLFILGLCAELAACRVLPRDTGNTDADMRSIMDDLLEALQKYSSVLRKMVRD